VDALYDTIRYGGTAEDALKAAQRAAMNRSTTPTRGTYVIYSHPPPPPRKSKSSKQ
jgi:hypothetical protein